MTEIKTKALAAGMLAALAATAPALAGPNEDAFANAGYTLCDARLLGVYWQDDLPKRVISQAGEKILTGYADRIAEAVADARQDHADRLDLCPAGDFYTAEDIMLFAKAWDMDSISEAQQKISELLVSGAKADIDDAIEMAR